MKKQVAHSKKLGSFFQSDSKLQTKIALLTFYNRRYSDWTEKIILLLEYLQIISLSLLFHDSNNADTAPSNSLFSRAVLYFFRLVNPSYLMPLNVHNPLSSTILIIVFSCMILKYLLLIYVAIAAFCSYPESRLALALWKFSFRTQSRILCFFITSFWSCALLGCLEDTFQVQGINKSVLICIFCLLILIEYAFSFYLEIHFNYVLPTQNFLAAKDCRAQVVTLIQKLILQLLHIGFRSSQAGLWLFSILNLLITAIQSYKFHDRLPLYSIKALYFQNKLYSIVISINLACLIGVLLDSMQYKESNTNFMIILWLLFSLFIVRVSYDLLAARITSILSMRSEENNPEILVHKVPAARELSRKFKRPGKNVKKMPFLYLLRTVQSTKSEEVFGLKVFQPEMSITDNRNNANDNDANLFVQYLTKLSVEFPTNTLIKLHLAHLCLEDPSLFLISLKTAAELASRKLSRSYLSTSLLICEIEKTIITEHHNQESALDLLAYIKSQVFIEGLEAKIQEQTDLKIRICKNILGETAKIGQIFNLAQEIDKCKQETHRKIKLLAQAIPDYYAEPSLLIAGHYLVLEYSPENFQKYIESYSQKQVKYDEYFEATTLTKENLYQKHNVFLMLSGEKTNCGQIIFCSDSIKSICGGKLESYKGSHVSNLFTPSFQVYYQDLFRLLFENGEKTLLNRIERAFLHDKDGYIVEVEFYIKIHPNLTQGLYLSIIIRPTSSPKEYLLIKEDGSIEGATKEISKTLLMNKSNKSAQTSLGLTNVKALAEELWKVNQAFNEISKITDPSKLSQYNCKVSLIPCGSTTLKVFELVKLNEDGFELNHVAGSFDGSRHHEPILKTRKTVGNAEGEYENDDNNLPPGPENIDCDENVLSNQMLTEWKGQTEFEPLSTLSPSHRRLLPDKPERKILEEDRRPSYLISQVDPVQELGDVLQKGAIRGNENQFEFMSSTQVPNVSNSKTANSTFRSAISIDFHPKSFRAICLMFYGVILITLLSQVILKEISDHTLEDLSVKKTLLSLSQLRTFKMLLIEINCRGNLNNVIDPNLNNGATYTGMAQTVSNMEGHMVDLKNYNDQILHNLNSLADDLQRNLFLKNTKISGSYIDSLDPSSRYVTTFEVVNEVIDAVHILSTLKGPAELLISNKASHLYNFVILNTLNDYLFQSQKITDIFVDSVQDQKDYFQSTITVCLIVTPLLLVGIALMLVAIILRQYNIENRHMLAIIRLQPKSIKDDLSRLTIFKTKIADRESKEFKEWLDSIGDSIMKAQQIQGEEKRESNYHKKHESQVIDRSETRARYFGYVLKMAFYILILIGVMLWNFISAQDSAKVIYKRQHQLEFANHLSEVGGVIYCGTHELFESNNTHPVKNGTAEEAVVGALEEITSLLSQMPEAFLEEDRTYDPTIKGMVFHYDNCDSYNFAPLHLFFCNFMVSHGAGISLLPLVTMFRENLRAKLTDYYACNRLDLLALLNCSYTNIDFWLPSFVLSSIEAQKIGQVIADNLDRGISDAFYQRKLFLIMFSLSLGIVSILIWLQILRKMRDVHNDFKKVLQVFPPTLILSSFLLKNFLMQHAKIVR